MEMGQQARVFLAALAGAPVHPAALVEAERLDKALLVEQPQIPFHMVNLPEEVGLVRLEQVLLGRGQAQQRKLVEPERLLLLLVRLSLMLLVGMAAAGLQMPRRTLEMVDQLHLVIPAHIAAVPALSSCLCQQQIIRE